MGKAEQFKEPWLKDLFLKAANSITPSFYSGAYSFRGLLVYAECVLLAVQKVGLRPEELTPEALKRLSLRPRIKNRRRERLAKNFFSRFMESAGLWERAKPSPWTRQSHPRLPALRETLLSIKEQRQLLAQAEKLRVPEHTSPNVISKKKLDIASVRLQLELKLKCGLKPEEFLKLRYRDVGSTGIKLSGGRVIAFGQGYHQVERRILDSYLQMFGPWKSDDYLFYRRKPLDRTQARGSTSLRDQLERLLPGMETDADVLHRSHILQDFATARSDHKFADHCRIWHGCGYPKIRRYGMLLRRSFPDHFRVPVLLPSLLARILGYLPADDVHWGSGRKAVRLTWNDGGPIAYMVCSASARDWLQHRRKQALKLFYAVAAQRDIFSWRMRARAAPCDPKVILHRVYGTNWREYLRDFQDFLSACRATRIRLRGVPGPLPLLLSSVGRTGKGRWKVRIPLLDRSAKESIWLPVRLIQLSVREHHLALLTYPWIVARSAAAGDREIRINPSAVAAELFGSGGDSTNALMIRNELLLLDRHQPNEFFVSLTVQDMDLPAQFTMPTPSEFPLLVSK